MAKATYDEALRRLLVHEGGYSNHPSDPGGPTNFGITIADYRRYVKPDATAADVRRMRLDEAKAIYRARYWDAMRCDELPAGLDYAAFDYAVNSGLSRAIKVLQRLLALPADGRMTDALIAAAQTRDAAEIVSRLCDERLTFLKQLKTWSVFGPGWDQRVAQVKVAALAMAARAKAQGETPPAVGKASVAVKPLAHPIAAVGIAAAGAALAHAVHQAGAHPAITAGIAVVTAAVAIGGWLAWRRHQVRQQVR